MALPAAGRRALVIGAVSRDLAAPGAERATPGGVVVHAGLALARLGARTHVVTRVRPEDAAALLAPLEAEGVRVLALPSRTTTTYANDYRGPCDRHVLLATSDPIGPADVPADWREADVVQLGPLHPEDLLPDTAAVLRGFRGLDVQGLVRAPGGDGSALRRDPALPRFLAHVEVVQASEPELLALLEGERVERWVARHGVRELVVTRGARGATVVTDGRSADVPVPEVWPHARAGAGDVFLAAYLVHRVRGDGPVESARAAARIAAQQVAHGEVPAGR